MRRSNYLDALRGVAIIRVVAYHTLGFGWLTVVFPSMGVMFALGGSLMAASLDRSGAKKAITGRLRRLLPVLWVFGAVTVPLMMWHGWSDLHPLSLLLYVVPIADPPGSTWGMENFTGVLWYLRAYLWFVLLSPLALRVFRRWPVPSLVLPLALLTLNELGCFNGATGAICFDLMAFGTCWMLGFAHRDGLLARPVVMVYGVIAALLAAVWVVTHPGPTLDLSGNPLGNALWSIAFILVLLHFEPRMRSVLHVLNARAVTVYLWHPLAILVGDNLLIQANLKGLQPWGVVILSVVWVLIGVIVVCLGWVEDLAAHRQVQLIPKKGLDGLHRGRHQPSDGAVVWR